MHPFSLHEGNRLQPQLLFYTPLLCGHISHNVVPPPFGLELGKMNLSILIIALVCINYEVEGGKKQRLAGK